MGQLFVSITAILYLFLLLLNYSAGAGVIGVNYGMLGDNLPSIKDTINLLNTRNIKGVRLFAPNFDALDALKGTEIQVILGTTNDDLQSLDADPTFSTKWVQTNIIPYAQTVQFSYIAVGNEVIPGGLAAHVLPAMKNLDNALKNANLNIPVSTSVATTILGNSFPPSKGEFSSDSKPIMEPITSFLASTKSPLLVNVYPYFAYASSPGSISLPYALFTATSVVVSDGQFEYKNLFDAILDSVYAALEKAGGSDVDVVVSESGWPSAGNGDIATIGNAGTYVNNLISHSSSGAGTPRRPGGFIETYVFALFNENQKPAGTEQNFGLYYPNMTEVYHVNF